jgi:hypothetical protein
MYSITFNKLPKRKFEKMEHIEFIFLTTVWIFFENNITCLIEIGASVSKIFVIFLY